MSTVYHRTCPVCSTPFTTSHKHQECDKRGCSRALRTERERETPATVAWGCGAGVDSTAIAVLIILGHLPKPEYAYMVNPGYERQRTWNHVNSVLIPRLAEVGVTLHILPSPNCHIVDNGHIRIPAFKRNDDGTVGRLNTHCGGWKRPVAMRWLKAQGVKRCEGWVGIAADESERQRANSVQWYTNRYPLVELELTRQDCLDLIARMGWEAPQTSCIMCPQQSDDQWQDTKENYPEDWARIVEIERDIHRTHPESFLHCSCVPINQVRFGSIGQANSDRIDRFF